MGRDAEKAVEAGRRGGRGAKERGRGPWVCRVAAPRLRGSWPSGEIRKISQIVLLTAWCQRLPRPATCTTVAANGQDSDSLNTCGIFCDGMDRAAMESATPAGMRGRCSETRRTDREYSSFTDCGRDRRGKQILDCLEQYPDVSGMSLCETGELIQFCVD